MVFSLSNLNSNSVFDSDKQAFVFSKLLCNSTVVPFNMAIVRFKWDFFKDTSHEQDQAVQALANLVQSQNQLNVKQIQGLVNFAEMQNHFDRNLTITLKGQGND